MIMDPSIIEQPASFEENGNEEAFIIQQNKIYGRHLVASRVINKGELVLEEFPLVASACGTAVPCGPLGPWAKDAENCFPFCLTCGKVVKGTEVCSRCKWPICDNLGVCENDPIHSEGECPIFVTNKVLPGNFTLVEYGVICVLRVLFIRSTDPSKWERLQQLEPLTKRRRLSPGDSQTTAFVIDFVQQKCKLIEFDAEIIDRVTGIVRVNAYWTFPYLGRCMSLVFEKGSLFSHDCDPNTREELFEKEHVNAGIKQIANGIGVRLIATKDIQPGDIIAIPYLYPSHITWSVQDRQNYLKTYYHFDCTCNRCIGELNEQKYSS